MATRGTEGIECKARPWEGSMTARVRPTSHMRASRLFAASLLIFATLLFSSQQTLAQFSQQGPKLVGTGAVGNAAQGQSVAVSTNGNTAIVGGALDNAAAGAVFGTGAAWVYTRSGGVWTQQGGKLVRTGAAGLVARQG